MGKVAIFLEHSLEECSSQTGHSERQLETLTGNRNRITKIKAGAGGVNRGEGRRYIGINHREEKAAASIFGLIFKHTALGCH